MLRAGVHVESKMGVIQVYFLPGRSSCLLRHGADNIIYFRLVVNWLVDLGVINHWSLLILIGSLSRFINESIRLIVSLLKTLCGYGILGG